MIEKPLVCVHGHHPFGDVQRDEIQKNVNRLNKADKAAFYELADVFHDAKGGPPEGVFLTNSFDMTDSPQGPSCAIYAAIARLNHSCCPNAQQTHIPDTREEVLYASRDIQIGEEINDCYIELRKGKHSRNRDLQEYFRFKCSCISCCGEESFSTEDDVRRERAMLLEDSMLTLTTSGDTWSAYNVSGELLKLLTNIDCLPWSSRYIPGAFYSAYLLCKELDKKKEAHQFLQEAQQWYVDLQGPSSPSVIIAFQSTF